MKRLIPSTILMAAMVLLLLTSGRAADKNTIEGLVVPDSISDKQPFTFAVPQTVEGEVVDVKAGNGEVVQHARADRYGRVFLSAGLAAGTYAVYDSQGGYFGNLKIHLRTPGDVMEIPAGIHLQNPPQVLKLSNPFSLNGTGFSPNCADMRATLNGRGQTEAPIVLAATKDQLKLAPVRQLQPGMAQLRVTNQATGQSTEPQQLLLYNISGEIGRRTIKSGHDETHLIVNVQPADMALTVRVNVVSGPVDFGGGRKEAQATTSNGQAIFPVHAGHGAGPFQLSWELVSFTSDTAPKDPEATVNDYTASHPHGSANLREAGFSRGSDEVGSAASVGNNSGGIFGDSSGKKDKKDDTSTSPTDPPHSKHCEWRFLRVEKTNYTMDNKQLAADKEKLGNALLSLVGKVAPTAGQVTKAVLKALSITKANNVYLVYILVENVDGAETAIDTKVVGPLEDNEAMDFWAGSDADGARQNTIARNKPKGGCPAR